MKSLAIVEYGKPLQEVESAIPTPQGVQVLVKISHAGVCHSDVHLQDGYVEIGDGEKQDWTGGRTLPHTLGHEIEGELAAVGADAETLLEGSKVGDRVVVFPWIGCGECGVCARDQEHNCSKPRQIGIQTPGGYSEYVLVPHPKYLLDATGVPEGLAATYMCSGVTAYAALKKIPAVYDGESILIIGLGGLGMMALQFARVLFPHAKVLGADIDKKKLEAAKTARADAVYNSKDPAALKQLRADTGGGVAAAVDFVGAAASMNYANGAIRRGGAIMVVGMFGGRFSTPIPLFPQRPFSIIGSYTGSLGETKEMLELVKAGKIKPIPIQTRPLSEANAALNLLREGKVVGRLILTP